MYRNGTAGIITNCLQDDQTILVEGQIYGLMLLLVKRYSVQRDHIAQQRYTQRIAAAGIIIIIFSRTCTAKLVNYLLIATF